MEQLTQKEKAELFLKYHHDDDVLVLLNSWDAGSSMLIEAAGFKAVATTSMGVAASLGYPDCEAIPFEEMLDAIKKITNRVNVPVTVDIEGGYGRNIKEILPHIEKIIRTGIVGINIEDSVDLNPELVDENEFCARISAIRELSESMGFHLVINARTDSFLTASGPSEKCMEESIRRGNSYRKAGADCIFIPRVWERDKIAELVKGINAPVNIVCNPSNGTGFPPPISELKELGLARLSVGSFLMKTTLAFTKKVADEMLGKGTYNNLSDMMTPLDNIVIAYKMATGT
jgi:2-methylisocitrate lyase-like PEP mutase family enzyme